MREDALHGCATSHRLSAQDREERFRILALSGGGCFGIFAVRILSLLEAIVGSPIARSFDLICGTSVSAITALALALEVPARIIERTYIAQIPRIFTPNKYRSRAYADAPVERYSLLRPKYSADPLRTALKDLIPEQATLADAKHRLVLPVVNLGTGEIEIFKTHSREPARHPKCPMIDVAIAASAAPTFFPIANVDGQLYVDGALFANAPDLIGLHEAEHYLGRDSSTIEVLSLGSTMHGSLPHGCSSNGLGRSQQSPHLLSLVMSTQQQLADQLLKHRLSDRYQRIDIDYEPDLQRSLSFDYATEHGIERLLSLADAIFRDAMHKEHRPLRDLAERMLRLNSGASSPPVNATTARCVGTLKPKSDKAMP